MSSRGVWLLLGPSVLWAVLLAAPHARTPGMPPLFHANEPETVTSSDGEAKDQLERQGEKAAAKGTVPLKGASIAKEGEVASYHGGGPLPTEKPLRSTKAPQPKGGLADRIASGPLGQPGPSETGAEGNTLSAEEPWSRVAPGEEPPLTPSLESLNFASEPVLPKVGCVGKKNATSGDKPASDGKPVSNSGHGKTTAANKPGLTGERGPGAGNTNHGKPVSGGKPICAGKPAPAAGHAAHVAPAPGGKPASHTGRANNSRTNTSAEPPASRPGQAAHGKPPAGDEPAPHGKPEAGGKPASEEKPKPEEEPEKEAGKNAKEGGEEDWKDLFDDDDDREVGDSDVGNGSSDEDEDAFDRELDYGLGTSPFNPFEYHDAWSDGGSEEREADVPEGDFGYNYAEPVFDARGDIVRQPKPEPPARKRSGRAGLFWDARED